MRLTLRKRLIFMASVTASAFLTLIVLGQVLTSRVDDNLNDIQDQYLPIVEAGPTLRAQFTTLRRGLQDAVAIRDVEELKSTQQLKEEIDTHLQHLANVLKPQALHALQQAIDAYYAAAYDVSKKLIAGETGVEVVESITKMQSNQAAVEKLLSDTVEFDRDLLDAAFTAVQKTQV